MSLGRAAPISLESSTVTGTEQGAVLCICIEKQLQAPLAWVLTSLALGFAHCFFPSSPRLGLYEFKCPSPWPTAGGEQGTIIIPAAPQADPERHWGSAPKRSRWGRYGGSQVPRRGVQVPCPSVWDGLRMNSNKQKTEGMVCDFQGAVIRDTTTSSLLFFWGKLTALFEDRRTAHEEAHLAEELRPPANSHVKEPPRKRVLPPSQAFR